MSTVWPDFTAPVRCGTCHGDMRGDGHKWVAMPCGYCAADCCSGCGRTIAADGPLIVNGEHHGACGFRGHRTVDEQRKRPVALLGRHRR